MSEIIIPGSGSSNIIGSSPTNPPSNIEEIGETYPTPDESLTIADEGMVVGRSRTYDEDNANIKNFNVITKAMNSTQNITIENNILSSNPANIPKTPKQTNNAVTPLTQTSDTYYSIKTSQKITESNNRKNNDDIKRALQKLQRKCNHLYSKITKRCIYCNKHRNSHVYDV